MLATDRFI